MSKESKVVAKSASSNLRNLRRRFLFPTQWFHKTEQRFLGSMEFSSAVGDQLFQRIKVVVNDFSCFEAINYLRANVRAAANCRSVTESISRLLDRFNDFSFSNRGFVRNLSARPGEGTSTNQRSGPRAKIFSAEALTHYFTDVRVDVWASDVDEFTISVLILEDFA